MATMSARLLAFALLLAAAGSAFSILSYDSDVTINHDGSITVRENMSFYLEQAYSEGYRSIRSQDFGSLSDITIGSVKVNGAAVPYALQMNGDKAEIVWKKTYAGTNNVELAYSIRDRVELYDDFAKLCFEHYGANWQVPASSFSARTTMPAGAAGKTMHFEVYSAEKGQAYVDNLSVAIKMNDVPAGNYIGGCYLFDKSAVITSNTVSGSAYAILKNEREIYGSESVLAAQNPNLECCCLPLFLIIAISAASFFMNERKRPALPESILPPGKEAPVVVSALVRNSYETKEIVAATIVDLINRGIIDIVELEKPGETGPGMKRERTILMLRKKPQDLPAHEKSVLDLVFGDKTEVDLDAEMGQYAAVHSKSDATSLPIAGRIKKFESEFPSYLTLMLKDPEISANSESAKSKPGSVIGWIFILGFLGIFIAGFFSDNLMNMLDIGWYFQHGEWLRLGAIVVSFFGIIACGWYSYKVYTGKPAVPKSAANLELYGKWDAFYRGLKSSRIKEYPPASAVIWGDILVYATALGLADKVKRHLSELGVLDPKAAGRMDAIDRVAIRSMAYYSSVHGIHNLATYGNRSGIVSSGGHGGFSSHSSGGWSSGGGGGFSGGSSGGGGFR